MDGLQLGSCLGIGLLLTSIFVSTQAQSNGFISIDCGSTPSSNAVPDAVTTFMWEGDDNYTSSGLNGAVPITVDSTLDNSEALKTFRYFPNRRSKYCYELLTSGNVTFLLRAMFLHGSAPELALPINFDVAVNGTILFPVQYNISDSSDTLNSPIVFEGIFQSPGILTHFCLVTGTGVPFISSLELREFDTQGLMYSRIFPKNSLYLENKWRINCGVQLGSPTVRYPDDPYDRLWQAPGDWGLTGFQSSTGTLSDLEGPNDGLNNKVPLKVMQAAWLNDSANSSWGAGFHGGGSAGRNKPYTTASVNFYHQEIESNVSSGDRLFDLSANPSLNGGWPNQTSYAYVYLDYSPKVDTPDEWVNFSVTALPNSKLGPILNAIEIYAQYLFNDAATATQDVDALASLQASFNLTGWQGDPCYPVSWEWVSCTGDTSARVQKLLLSGMGIDASIPPTISDLDALTEINLSNNSLYGTIPDSLAALHNLHLLALDNNNLSGDVPADLVQSLGPNLTYSGNLLLKSNSSSTPKKKASNVGLIIGATAGGVVGVGIVVGVLIWWCCWSKRTKSQPRNLDHVEIGSQAKQTTARPSPFWQAQPVDNVLPQRHLVNQLNAIGSVPYETVQTATGNFKEKIGQGSYGSVYHGWLNQKEVAVKVNNIQSQQGQNEFTTEVEILTRVHHRNLVSLVGFCNEGSEHILIYEFQVNGTLHEWLHEKEKSRGTLDWKTRLQIALDAAKGLEYLHKGCDPTIIHRDVKSNNILLDENMTAKVADFGLSKSTPIENSRGYSTVVKGTRGYLDPEYHKLERLTRNSDIYSFGVVLAEIITGRTPFSMQTDGTMVILVEFVQKLVQRNDIEALADPSLRGEFNPESLWTMADIVLSCTNPVGAKRPDMGQVVSSISEAIDIEKTFASHSPLVSSRSFSLTRSSNSLGYNSL